MPPSALRFGPFVLDLERLCLRGPAGEAELRPKSFEVLRHLAERPRRVVPKEALIEAVWPDVTVTDDSLTRCIGEVRRALAADASRPGDQTGHAGDDPAGPPFVAVLPFANLSGEPADVPFCDGTTED